MSIRVQEERARFEAYDAPLYQNPSIKTMNQKRCDEMEMETNDVSWNSRLILVHGTPMNVEIGDVTQPRFVGHHITFDISNITKRQVETPTEKVRGHESTDSDQVSAAIRAIHKKS